MSYQKPICDCGGELVFISKRLNSNSKHEVRKILSNGKLSKKLYGEIDWEINRLEDRTKCLRCGTEWRTYYDKKGRVR